MTENIVGANLRRIRTDKGLTQQQLEKLSGVHYVLIHQYEAGKRSPGATNIKKLADALRVNPGELF